MEQTIAFVLGVFTVLALAGVVSMFKTRGQIKDLYTEIEDLQNLINELERDYHRDNDLLDRRIDGEIDRVDNIEKRLFEYADGLHNHLEEEMNKLYGYVDSRTDKMEDRIKGDVAQLVSDIYSNMEAKFNDNTAFVDGLYHSLNELSSEVLVNK